MTNGLSGSVTTEEWIRNKIKNAPSYKVKSKSLDISKPDEYTFLYLDLNGDIYMPPIVISGFARWKMPKFIIEIPNKAVKEIIIDTSNDYKNATYIDGVDVFLNEGLFYLNISSIGLITTLVGDTVWIEKAE